MLEEQYLLDSNSKVEQQIALKQISKKDKTSLVYAWGKNQEGQLSLGTNKNVIEPTQIRSNVYARQIASASSHSALISQKYQLYVAGSNSHDRLGLNEQGIISRFKLQINVSARRVKQVACGDYHTLALLESGQVFSWGGSLGGKKGQGGPQSRQVISPLKFQIIVEIACGDYHSLALTQKGQIYSWGGGVKDKNKGQLGHNNLKIVNQPLKIDFFKDKRVKKIACGHYHTMALTTEQQLYAWGEGMYGQLGCGGFKDEIQPKKVQMRYLDNIQKQYFQSDRIKEPFKIQQLALGGKHSLILTNKGLYVCGYNQQGQLGLGNTKNIFEPILIEVFIGRKITMVAAGTNHSLVLTNKHDIYACGNNGLGQLGLGDQKITSRTVWTHIKRLSGKRTNRIYAGGHHSWAIIDQYSPDIEDYEPPSPIQQYTQFPSRLNEIENKNNKSAVSNLTFIEDLYSKTSLEVIYTQVQMHHRFIKFTLKQESAAVKHKLNQYSSFCKQVQKQYFKYQRIQQDSDLYDANGNIVTSADKKSYTIMMVCDCNSLIQNSHQNSRKQQNRLNVAIGQLVILKQNQLKIRGQIPIYNKWFFKFNELFDGLLERVRFLELRPKNL